MLALIVKHCGGNLYVVFGRMLDPPYRLEPREYPDRISTKRPDDYGVRRMSASAGDELGVFGADPL